MATAQPEANCYTQERALRSVPAARYPLLSAPAIATDDPLEVALEALTAGWRALGALVVCHTDPPGTLIVRAFNAGAEGSHLRRTFLHYAQEAVEDYGSLHAAGMRLVSTGRFVTAVLLLGGSPVSCTFLMASNRTSTKHAVHGLEQSLPLLQAFLLQWRANERLVALARSFGDAMEHHGTATILLGPGAEIRHANAAARRLLDEGSGMRQRGEQLACAHMDDTLRLLAAISHVGAADSEDRAAAPVLMIRRPCHRPLLVTLVGAGSRGMGQEGVAAFAYITDPEQNLTEIVEPACRLYGLSPSETRLACALADGASLQEAAKAQSVQEQTARSYLKQIFAKTETKRQGELVQLMLKSAIRAVSTRRKRAFR